MRINFFTIEMFHSCYKVNFIVFFFVFYTFNLEICSKLFVVYRYRVLKTVQQVHDWLMLFFMNIDFILGLDSLAFGL